MKRRAPDDYREPAYPRRDQIDPDHLARWMPSRWRSGRAAGKVAAGMSLILAVPGAASADVSPPPDAAGKPTGKPGAKPAGDKARVARVFEHGEGRGAFGCVAVAPPAFLTEADARQVILEEFAKLGVKFELDKKVVPGLREREVTMTYQEKPAGGFERSPREKLGGPITLDGYDPARNLGFEYVSEADYFKLGGPRSASTVQDYDFQKVARRLSEDAKRDGTVRLGVFYNPMARAEWVEDEEGNYRDSPNDAGKRQLRAQVRDFIAWLRAEKVIP